MRTESRRTSYEPSAICDVHYWVPGRVAMPIMASACIPSAVGPFGRRRPPAPQPRTLGARCDR
eukprot:1672992-Prymnesium_polylepis.1